MDKPQIPFVEFPKIARFSKDVVVSEKIDGVNACVHVNDTMTEVYAGSRTKWISLDDDNKGFARWVNDHRDELLKLGPGNHFGEWWGSGIARGYGLKNGEKRFSLFNTHRWYNPEARPACCDVVPVLYTGPLDTLDIELLMAYLRSGGSIAAPGFMNPEGVVVFHTVGRWLLKKTFDDQHKGAAE